MTRNNADFAAGLFHGSYHPFEVGDIVSGNENMPAYATDSHKEAAKYGDVYQVEPLSVDDSYKTPTGTTNVESHKGFRVVKQVK
jgi:hypothetical protein